MAPLQLQALDQVVMDGANEASWRMRKATRNPREQKHAQTLSVSGASLAIQRVNSRRCHVHRPQRAYLHRKALT
jgi:hypothetical protein